jgi:hypothetical protein
MVNMAFRTNPGLLSQQIIGLPPWTITTSRTVAAGVRTPLRNPLGEVP